MQSASSFSTQSLTWFLPKRAFGGVVAGAASLLWEMKSNGSSEVDPSSAADPATQTTTAPVAPRQDDALYQNNRIVARVLDPEVDLEAKEIRFGLVYQSDELLLPEECEFQKYRILIQRLAHASKIDQKDPTRGRVLTAVTADILGYREQ